MDYYRDLIVQFTGQMFVYGAYLLTVLACLYGVFVFTLFFIDKIIVKAGLARDFQRIASRYYKEKKESQND